MIGVAMYTTIKTLWELGKNKSEIAKLTGYNWKTVQNIINLVGGCNLRIESSKM